MISSIINKAIKISTFGLLDLEKEPDRPPTPQPNADASAASTEEAKRLTALRSRGGTLLTGGLGLEDDEDIVKKKTLLGA